MGRILAAVGAVVAIGVGIGATVYLRSAQQTIERAVEPVAVPLAALFPPDSHAVVTVRDLDTAYAELAAWWDDFDDTAAWYALKKRWNDDRAFFPSTIVEILDTLERELDAAQTRLGYRPTSGDFFEVYGKESAVGILPGADGTPRMLALTRLPDQARADALRGTLGAVPELKRVADTGAHGYPVFAEPLDDGAERFYAVGGGFLFVSDDRPAIEATLARLAAHADPSEAAPPPPSLLGNAIVERVAPAAEPPPVATVFLRKDQAFGQKVSALQTLDDVIGRAFVLAGDDPAVAFALHRASPGKWDLRASFFDDTPRPWMAILPAGLTQLHVALPDPARAAAALKASMAQLEGKALWKEIEALLSDEQRMATLFEEAMPPSARPDAEVTRRLKNDARLLARLGRDIVAELGRAGPSDFAIAARLYPDAAPAAGAQWASGWTLGPEIAFTLTGALELLSERLPQWLTHEVAPGRMVWRINLDGLRREMRRMVGSQMPFDPLVEVEPVVILAGRTLVLVSGRRLAGEIIDLLDGKAGATAITADPLFQKAIAGLPKGYTGLSFMRPRAVFAGRWTNYRGVLQRIIDDSRPSRDARDLLGALFAMVDEGFAWTAAQEAHASASYPDGALQSVSRTLLDAEEERKAPPLTLEPGPITIMDWLPAATWSVSATRAKPRLPYDRLRQAFLDALPGGADRLRRLRTEAGLAGERWDTVLDALIDGLLRNVSGEMGFAVAVTPDEPNAPPMRGMPDPLAQLPAMFLFAQFEDPDGAWDAIRTLIVQLDSVLNPEPLNQRMARFERGEGPPPMGVRVSSGNLGEAEIIVAEFFIPIGMRGQYVRPTLCVVRRGDRIIFTNSGPYLEPLAKIVPGKHGSLAMRLRQDLPADALPAEATTLHIEHSDGMANQYERNMRLQVPQFLGLTLGGFRRRPPQVRIDAHRNGWQEAIRLVVDVFRTGEWIVEHGAREGDNLVVRRRRFPGK